MTRSSPGLTMDNPTQANLPEYSGQYWRKKQGCMTSPVGRTAFAVLNTVKVHNPSETSGVFTSMLTNAPNQDMVAPQVEKGPVGIRTLSNTRRMTDRALKARFSYGRANGRAVWLPVTGSGSSNPVRPAASEIRTSSGRFLKPTTRRPVMAHTLQAESAQISHTSNLFDIISNQEATLNRLRAYLAALNWTQTSDQI